MEDKETILLPLFELLKGIAPIHSELTMKLLDSFHLQKYEKGTVLLHEGSVCVNLWFLAKGVLRSYHNIGEKEVTSRIMFTNHIVIAPGSFFTQTPSTESIEAVSDCTVAKLSFGDLQKIYSEFPEFNYHTRLITEQYFYKQEQRLYMLRKHDAASKYVYFLENYSDYLQDIPQKYIASFLNIAPETLSRTRSNLRNK